LSSRWPLWYFPCSNQTLSRRERGTEEKLREKDMQLTTSYKDRRADANLKWQIHSMPGIVNAG